jgi:hypothetical protein
MGWTMLYLFVFLKLPILALGGIVYWAIKQNDEEEPVLVRDDGGAPKPRHPHRRPPRRPRPPRRGPHTGTAAGRMASPPRIRSVTAFGRESHTHR